MCIRDRIQVELPESVESPRSYVAQIQRRRPRAPHAVGVQRDLMIKMNVGIFMPLVAGKPGREHRFFQRRRLRNLNRLAIQLRAFA